MSTNDNQPDLEDLQRQMQMVRGELKHDVDDFVESTKKLVDWRSYVTSFPVATTVAAMVAGYMLIPSKKQILSPDADDLAKLAKRNKLVVQMKPTAQRKSSLGGTLFGLASSMLVRGVTSYVGQKAGKISSGLADDRQRESGPVSRDSNPSTNPPNFQHQSRGANE